jgi:hypothetical protein
MHSSAVRASTRVRWLDLLAEQWPQVLVSLASVSIVAAYGSAYGILESWIAWGLAIGWEAINLKGLADSARVRSWWGRFWAYALIVVAAITVATWGILYILSLEVMSIVPKENIGPEWGIVIAIIHIVPMVFTTLCSSALHVVRQHEAQAEAERVTMLANDREAERREAERERERRAEEMEAKRRERLIEIELEAEAERRRIALEAEAKRAEDQRQVERLKLRREVSIDSVKVSAVTPVTPQPDAELTREEKRQLARKLTLSDGVSVAEAARQIGVSRGTIYNYVPELRAKEEVA